MKDYCIPLSHDYEPFLNTLKAYCILWVVFCHIFPFLQEIGYPIIGAIQVPLFFIIQAFHFYKFSDSKLSLKKLFKRIFLPFLFIVSLQLLILYAVDTMGGVHTRGCMGGGW